MGNFQTIPVQWQDGSEKHASRHFKCPNSELWKDPIQPLSTQMFLFFLFYEQFFCCNNMIPRRSRSISIKPSFLLGAFLCTTWQSSLTSQVLSVRPGFALDLFHGFFQENVSVPSLVADIFSGSRRGIAATSLPPPNGGEKLGRNPFCTKFFEQVKYTKQNPDASKPKWVWAHG